MNYRKLLTISLIISFAAYQPPLTAFAEDDTTYIEELSDGEATFPVDEKTEDETTAETETEEITDSESEITSDTETSSDHENNDDLESDLDEDVDKDVEENIDEDLNSEEEEEDEEIESFSTLSVTVMKPAKYFDEKSKSPNSYITALENSCSFEEGVSTTDAIQSILSPKYNSAEYNAICSAKLPEKCPEDLKIKLYMDENNKLESIDISYTEENTQNEDDK